MTTDNYMVSYHRQYQNTEYSVINIFIQSTVTNTEQYVPFNTM